MLLHFPQRPSPTKLKKQRAPWVPLTGPHRLRYYTKETSLFEGSYSSDTPSGLDDPDDARN